MRSGRGHVISGAGCSGAPGFLRFFPLSFVWRFPFGIGCGGFGACTGGRSVTIAEGDGNDDAGDNDVISIEGDRCLFVDDGELGDGESSGAGGGGKIK